MRPSKLFASGGLVDWRNGFLIYSEKVAPSNTPSDMWAYPFVPTNIKRRNTIWNKYVQIETCFDYFHIFAAIFPKTVCVYSAI